MYDYSGLDASPLVDFLFYPRRFSTPCPAGASDLSVAVDEGVSISCRFYGEGGEKPWILYFHGNGEVVSDYDEIAPFYRRRGINLVVADYRGYGASRGSPSFSSLLTDARRIFDAVNGRLREQGSAQNLWLMGRSLGSISALELAVQCSDAVKGLVIESGFASISRLIRHLGLPAAGIDLDSLDRERVAMIARITTPTLIVHGELDRLVPLQEAKDLFSLLKAPEKRLIVIPGADHNNIIFADLEGYFGPIEEFVRGHKG